MYDIFKIPDFKFPNNFVWGTSTAGHQIEGNNISSNNYKDELLRPHDPTGKAKPSGMACNHYNMVDEDISLMKDFEYPTYRMSVEWSRIEPDEGNFNQDAIDHYLREISKLNENGIKVMMTLHHFTHPAWFDDLGGFKNLDNRKYFERFAEKVVPVFSSFVDSWNVFNEFNTNPDKISILRYHALGYYIIKKYSKAPVSTAHAFTMYDAVRRHDIFDATLSQYKDIMYNEFFFHAIRTGEVVYPGIDGFFDNDIKDTCDFWAVNMYTREMVDARKKDMHGNRYAHKYLRLVDMDFYLDEFFPEAVIHNLTRLRDKPVIITENGCCADDDKFRIVYISLYLSALYEAMKMGVDVRGYIHWSFMDNYEWTSFLPKFGLIDVDFETFKRTPKPSAYFYKDIIKNNGFNQEILRKYIDRLPTL